MGENLDDLRKVITEMQSQIKSLKIELNQTKNYISLMDKGSADIYEYIKWCGLDINTLPEPELQTMVISKRNTIFNKVKSKFEK